MFPHIRHHEQDQVDPHLKRLGEYLAGLEVGWGPEDFDWLEQNFLEEPWLNWIKIVMVADSENAPKPFVLVSNTRGQAHINCALDKYLAGMDEVHIEPQLCKGKVHRKKKKKKTDKCLF